METRNYIELGFLALGFISMLIWKLATGNKVSKFNGMKGENPGTANGKIVGKLGNRKKH